MWRKGNTFALLISMQTGAATVESSMELLQKIKNGTASWPSVSTSGYIPIAVQNTDSKEYVHPYVYWNNTYNSQTWEQPKCPSVDERIKMLWYIYHREYYLAVKKKKVLPFAIAWMDLENIMPSEMSQSEKDKYHMILLICGI